MERCTETTGSTAEACTATVGSAMEARAQTAESLPSTSVDMRCACLLKHHVYIAIVGQPSAGYMLTTALQHNTMHLEVIVYWKGRAHTRSYTHARMHAHTILHIQHSLPCSAPYKTNVQLCLVKCNISTRDSLCQATQQHMLQDNPLAVCT